MEWPLPKLTKRPATLGAARPDVVRLCKPPDKSEGRILDRRDMASEAASVRIGGPKEKLEGWLVVDGHAGLVAGWYSFILFSGCWWGNPYEMAV